MITPQVVKALLAVLPAKTRLFPVGGITLANMDPYLAAGVSGFGIGSSLFKPGMAVTKIEENASKFIAAYARRI
jgi:2-dehydro-3-deoxyphosphogalactonate aldolase